ncbi:hypothetical protein Dalk_4536 [Desulfatibacillum aliphaticivorans]|uniref:Uncharacterized protein n=1 Tax=Desulfatibacillum aliphaticivorans TaxID=218208 RepID=B8FCQ1_DESAL|nr:hypothetical protein [Desulfatibacillum aliphaticivorans]ACL06214.1 hypothetical protein Dalk_4536 [Desulfatibacillum aliphaticivorans]
MTGYEDISVIPIFIGINRIYDSEIDHSWDNMVYIGTQYSKAVSAVIGAKDPKNLPDTASAQGIIKHFHLLPNGDMRFLMWEGDK